MSPVDQPAHDREMAARDAVKCVPEIARNHCPTSAKYAGNITATTLSAPFSTVTWLPSRPRDS